MSNYKEGPHFITNASKRFLDPIFPEFIQKDPYLHLENDLKIAKEFHLAMMNPQSQEKDIISLVKLLSSSLSVRPDNFSKPEFSEFLIAQHFFELVTKDCNDLLFFDILQALTYIMTSDITYQILLTPIIFSRSKALFDYFITEFDEISFSYADVQEISKIPLFFSHLITFSSEARDKVLTMYHFGDLVTLRINLEKSQYNIKSDEKIYTLYENPINQIDAIIENCFLFPFPDSETYSVIKQLISLLSERQLPPNSWSTPLSILLTLARNGYAQIIIDMDPAIKFQKSLVRCDHRGIILTIQILIELFHIDPDNISVPLEEISNLMYHEDIEIAAEAQNLIFELISFQPQYLDTLIHFDFWSHLKRALSYGHINIKIQTIDFLYKIFPHISFAEIQRPDFNGGENSFIDSRIVISIVNLAEDLGAKSTFQILSILKNLFESSLSLPAKQMIYSQFYAADGESVIQNIIDGKFTGDEDMTYSLNIQGVASQLKNIICSLHMERIKIDIPDVEPEELFLTKEELKQYSNIIDIISEEYSEDD